MDRNPETRLGSSEEDQIEIRKHPFFDGLDWNALVELKIEAPYIPEIRTDEVDPNSGGDDNNVLSEIKQ